MTKKLLFVSILLALSFALLAADVTGKWTFEMAGRQGGNPATWTMDLKQSGGTITGTVSRPGRNGTMEAQITDGKITGDNISFKTTQQMGGNTVTSDYSGTVSGSEMKLKISRPGRDGNTMTNEVTAKKSTT